jgi:hypothetical protein
VYAEYREPWHGLLIDTTNDVPGQRIVQVPGEVFGVTVQVRDTTTHAGAVRPRTPQGCCRGTPAPPPVQAG